MSALSPINRESELRTDAAKLAKLWSSAQIIHMVDRRLSAADDSLTFIDAAAVTALSDVFVQGDRFFLGIGRDDNQREVWKLMCISAKCKGNMLFILQPVIWVRAINAREGALR